MPFLEHMQNALYQLNFTNSAHTVFKLITFEASLLKVQQLICNMKSANESRCFVEFASRQAMCLEPGLSESFQYVS